jgi:hypothetical protein
MEYFAGLFDAEGYVSLLKDGHFVIGTEMGNEEVPALFQEKFGTKKMRKIPELFFHEIHQIP